MPGHKGKENEYDITEINGADVLYPAKGIIAESERNAAKLFRTYRTFYSAEGSTLAIKAMLALVTAGKKEKRVLAGRNAHKSFIYGCAMLDIQPEWIYPDIFTDICSCTVRAEKVREYLSVSLPDAVYITSPDYLGRQADIPAISAVCKEYGVPLLVDNAHGAYTAFLKESEHPIHLGADMCCDSAHKSLPVLTGGAYLHISESGKKYAENAESALAMFASTSPSYAILASLDRCNAYVSEGYAEKLFSCTEKVKKIKEALLKAGYTVYGTEKTKITFSALEKGYTGYGIYEFLEKENVIAEYADTAYTVLMVTPENTDAELEKLVLLLLSLKDKAEKQNMVFPSLCRGEKVISVREAMLAEKETVAINEAEGRICACPTVSCPPAVPIVISGERINKNSVELFRHYGIQDIEVVK